MNRARISVAATALCVLALVWTVHSPARGGDGEVRLYTNADLERFPLLPDSEVEAARPAADDWRVVTDYLQRQYARVDAERAYALERERAEAEVDLIRRGAGRRTYGLPYTFLRYGPYHRVPRKPPRDGAIGRITRGLLPDGAIRPLHAGPTRAQIDHARASRRSGSDAFPSNSRANASRGARR
jgi:hypothetical protein